MRLLLTAWAVASILAPSVTGANTTIPTIPEPPDLNRKLWEQIVFNTFDCPPGGSCAPLEGRATRVLLPEVVGSLGICHPGPDEEVVGKLLEPYATEAWWRGMIMRWTGLPWSGRFRRGGCDGAPAAGWIHVEGGDVGTATGRASTVGSQDGRLAAGAVIRMSTTFAWWRDEITDPVEVVLAHELGHVLGFYHVEGGHGFVMRGDYRWSPDEPVLTQLAYRVGSNVRFPGVVYRPDTTVPTLTITSAASEPVSGPFSVTVTFSEPVTGFELADLVVGNGSASELQGSEATYTATVTPAASGTVTVDIAAGAAEDGAGNPSAAADQFSITADTTAPTVTITSDASEPVSGPFSVTVTFSEPVTGFELADLVVGNGSTSELQGSEATYTATVTPAASGTVTVDIAAGAAEDSAGNPSAVADQFSITADTDTAAPTVTITSDASEPVSGPFSVTVTFSEPVTGFELADLVVGNGSTSELQGSEATYTATVTPAASGTVTVDIAAGAAEDSAGNPSAVADQFSITADTDTAAPTVTITSDASEPVSGPFSVTVTFSEPVTGFELADLVVGNGSASELQGSEATYTATVTPAASGTVTVDIAAGAAEDGAGNPSAAADQFSITVDLMPVPVLPLAGAIVFAVLLLVGGVRRRN